MIYKWLSLLLLLLSQPAIAFAQLPDFPASDELSNPRRLGFGAIFEVDWSPDGQSLALAAEGGVYILPYDQETQAFKLREIKLFSTQLVPASGLDYSPNGTQLAVALENGSVEVRDAVSGAIQRILTGHTPHIYEVAYSPDGRWLASADADIIRVWEAQSGVLLRTFSGHSAIAFSPDSRLIAAASEGAVLGQYDHAVQVWELETGQETYRLSGATNVIRAISFNPQGTAISAGDEDGEVRLWELADQGEVFTRYNPEFTSDSNYYDRQIWDIVFSPDQPWLIVAGYGPVRSDGYNPILTGMLNIWDTETHEHLTPENQEDYFDLSNHYYYSDAGSAFMSVALHPQDKIIAVGGRSHLILWDLAHQQELINIGNTATGHPVFLVENQNYIVSSGRIWDRCTGVALSTANDYRTAQLVSPSARFMLYSEGGEGRHIRFWEVTTQGDKITISDAITLSDYADCCSAPTFSNTDMIVYPSDEATLRVYDPVTQAVIHDYPLPEDVEVYDGYSYTTDYPIPYLLLPAEDETLSYHQLAEDEYTISENGTLTLLMDIPTETDWYALGYRTRFLLFPGRGEHSFLTRHYSWYYSDGQHFRWGIMYDEAGQLRVVGNYASEGSTINPPDLPLTGVDEAYLYDRWGETLESITTNLDQTVFMVETESTIWLWDRQEGETPSSCERYIPYSPPS